MGPWSLDGLWGSRIWTLFSAQIQALKRGSHVPTLPGTSGHTGDDLRRQGLYLPLFLPEIPNTDLGVLTGSGGGSEAVLH